jgi:hypothetical protein
VLSWGIVVRLAQLRNILAIVVTLAVLNCGIVFKLKQLESIANISVTLPVLKRGTDINE